MTQLKGNHHVFFFVIANKPSLRWEIPQQSKLKAQNTHSLFLVPLSLSDTNCINMEHNKKCTSFHSAPWTFYEKSGICIYASYLSLAITMTSVKRNRCLSLVLEASVTWTHSSSSSSPFSLVRPKTNGLCSTDTQEVSSLIKQDEGVYEKELLQKTLPTSHGLRNVSLFSPTLSCRLFAF